MRRPKLHPTGSYSLWGISAVLLVGQEWVPDAIRGEMPEVSGPIVWTGMAFLLLGLLWADLSNPKSAIRTKLANWAALFDANDAWPAWERPHTLHVKIKLTMRKRAYAARVQMIVHRHGPHGTLVHEFSEILDDEIRLEKHDVKEYRLGSVPLEGNQSPTWCNEQPILGLGKYVISIRMTAKRRFPQTHKIYLEMLASDNRTCGRFVLFDQSFMPFGE